MKKILIVLALLVSINTFAMTEVTDKNFIKEIFESKLPVIQVFYIPTCGFCKQLESDIDLIESSYNGKIKFVKTNSSTFLGAGDVIKAIPTVFLIKNKKIVNGFVGYKEVRHDQI
jgi:thioredoxin 1